MRIFLKILLLGFIHRLIQFLVLAVGSTLAEMNFEPSIVVDIFEILSKLLLLPLVLPILEILPDNLPSIVQNIPFIINSLLWGAGIYFGWKKWRQKSNSTKENVAV
ncbi:MAG: hypothetical protein BalsKO_29320 [Balneolaceae bacterium]